MTLPFDPKAPEDVQLAVSPDDSPLHIARGVDYPDQNADPTLKVAWVDKQWRAGNVDAIARYKQATYNTLYANGRQWLSWKKSQQNWEDLPLPVGDFRVTMNYVVVLLRARLQRLMPSEINWRCIPPDNSYHERDKAKVAERVINSRYAAQQMEQKVRRGLYEASITGFTALKSFWNSSIGPLTCATKMFPQPVPGPNGEVVGVQMVEQCVDQNGDPVPDEAQAYHYRPGDTDTSLRNVFNIRLNPEATGWTESEGLLWLIDSDFTTLSVARERYPEIAQKIQMYSGDETAMTYERMIAGSATQKAFVEFTTSPYAGSTQSQLRDKLCVIREYWEMKSKFFPNGRLIVCVGGQVAYDGDWPQGVFPYAPLFGEPAPYMPYGRPPINDMLSPQDVLNREYTAVAREMWASGTGKFVSWAIPGVPDQISKNDDEVIQVPLRSMLMNRPIHDVFQRLPAAVVSPDRWNLIQHAQSTLFDIGSYHEVSRGQIPPGLDSGVAIQYLLEQESAQLKDAVEALRRSLILWGRQQLAIAKWGYGEDMSRWIPVDRPDMDYSIEGVRGVDLPDPETLNIDIEYFRPHSEAAVRSEVKDLLAMGTIDPRTALKVLDLGGGFENAFQSETRHYAKASQENLSIQTGRVIQQMTPQGPMMFNPDGSPLFLPFDDDHAIHIDVHNEIALDPSQPWPVRQMMLAHIAQHRTAEQQLTMAMAVQQGAAAQGVVPGNPYTPVVPPEAAGAGHATLNRPNYAATHGGR